MSENVSYCLTEHAAWPYYLKDFGVGGQQSCRNNIQYLIHPFVLWVQCAQKKISRSCFHY